MGPFHWQDMEHHFKAKQQMVDCRVLFRSLDRPEDIKKILSLDLTGAWFNEMREFPLVVINRMAERVGRYPAVKDGGCSWYGLWGDTNPPDEDHWLAQFEAEPPEGWKFFIQPPGLVEQDGKLVTNPEAENLHHLPRGYYEINLGTMRPEEVKVYRRNQFGFVVDGKPVTPEFRPELHVRQDLRPLPNEPLLIGVDIGGGTLNPAATLMQRNKRGAYLFLAEVVCQDMGVDNFARLLKTEVALRFPEHVRRVEDDADEEWITVYGDPAGYKRDELYETVVFEHLRKACGFLVRAAPTQDLKLRVDALRAPMQRMIDGLPSFMVHPRCRRLIRGLGGGWHYRRVASSSGNETYLDKPDKGEYSHPCEAAAYVLLSIGELRTLKAQDVPERYLPPVAQPARWVV